MLKIASRYAVLVEEHDEVVSGVNVAGEVEKVPMEGREGLKKEDNVKGRQMGQKQGGLASSPRRTAGGRVGSCGDGLERQRGNVREWARSTRAEKELNRAGGGDWISNSEMGEDSGKQEGSWDEGLIEVDRNIGGGKIGGDGEKSVMNRSMHRMFVENEHDIKTVAGPTELSMQNGFRADGVSTTLYQVVSNMQPEPPDETAWMEEGGAVMVDNVMAEKQEIPEAENLVEGDAMEECP